MLLIYEYASKKEGPLYNPRQDAALMPRGWSRVNMLPQPPLARLRLPAGLYHAHIPPFVSSIRLL